MTLFRKFIRLHFAAAATMAIAVMAVPGGGSQAQTPNEFYALQQRLSQLEEQLFNLRSRLDGGGGRTNFSSSSSGNSGGDPGSVAELSVRVDGIEQQLRQMNGQVERVNHEIQKLNQQFGRFSEDTEFRFRALEKGEAPRPRSSNDRKREPEPEQQQAYQPPPQPAYQAGRQPSYDQNRQNRQNQQNQPSAGGGPLRLPGAPRQLGRQQGSAQPLQADNSGLSYTERLNKAPPASTLGTIPSGSLGGNAGTGGNGGRQLASVPGAPERTPQDVLYERSYENLLARRFDAAEGGFKNFLRKYPGHKLAGNAQYWLGETYYARGRYKDAATAFVGGYRRFSDSPKAKDSLLKLAITLKQLGQKPEACATFNQFKSEFPNAPAAMKSRANTERKSLSC